MSAPVVEEPGRTAVNGSRLQRLGPVVLGIFGGVFFAAVLPLVLLAQVPDTGNRGDAWVGTLVVMIVSGTWLGILIAGGRLRMLQFIAWLFVYVFFGLAVTVQLRSGDMPGTTPDLDPGLDWPTVGVIVLGIAAFAAGLIIESVRDTSTAIAPRSVDLRRATILVVVGLTVLAYTVSKVGVAVLFTDRVTHDAAFAAAYPDPSTAAVIEAFGVWPVVVGTQGLVQWARAHRGADGASRRARARARAIAVTAAFLELTYINPTTSARYVFGTVWGSYLAPLGAFRSRLSTAVTMLGVVIAFILLFPLANAFRGTSTDSFSRPGFFEEYAGNGDYDSFGQVSNAIRAVAEHGITWGGQFLGVLLFFVPRSIWSSKPTDTGILLAERRGYAFSNLSAPLWAEGYINFGIVGVVVVFILLGMLVQRLDVQGAAALRLGGAAALPASILPFYVFILLRGSLLQATGSLVVLIAAMWFVRTRARSDRLPRRPNTSRPGRP